MAFINLGKTTLDLIFFTMCWNPHYTVRFECVFDYSKLLQLKHPDNMVSITVLQKNLEYAYPIDPYSKWGKQILSASPKNPASSILTRLLKIFTGS